MLDQSSMEALKAASAARTAHEIADHDYRHVRLGDDRPPAPPWSRPKAGKPQGSS